MPAHADTYPRMPDLTVLDFTARWCAPCRTMTVVLDALAPNYAGGVELVAVEVDDEPARAQQFLVKSMPTLVLLRGGREVGRVVGTRPRAFIAGVIERALAGDVAIAPP